ncbi:unnamed protein product [Rotaria socialis]|uniref:Uncharacterized protein n=1 Tax=Rotaria socialis TaxID=392032 RepID=A0A817YKZ0_9BILA|nr:unnamed protein product [Rotaria socialis]
MFSTNNRSTLRKTRSRRQKSKLKPHHSTQSTKLDHRTTTPNSSLIHRFHDILNDLRPSWTRFLSYSILELEPICHQLAIQQMSSATSVTEYCPLACVFCQSFIYEPITLYCGHTFCDQCMKDESSAIDCPRCPQDIQGQIQSPIVHARENSYEKNRFLLHIFEQSEQLRKHCQTILLRRKGQNEYAQGNFQKAIDTYSQIIDEYDSNDHLALYNRAKAYLALQNYDQGLLDATHVITVKPHWIKGYLCQSEILFEMQNYTAALMSSLKALVIDPENPTGKQLMARHLHAVLHNIDDDDDGGATTTESELEQLQLASLFQEHPEEKNSTENDDNQLKMCKLSQSSGSCCCLLLDGKNLNSTDFGCSICCNLLWFPITTPCGHVFCRECVIRSVDNTQAKCPICKSSLQNFFPMLIQSHVNKSEIISKIIETYFPIEFNERRQIYEQENIRGASMSSTLMSNEGQTESQIFEIPIFVCVLAFPNCVCPLHVFEPRYRLMMRRSIETQSRIFGMCAYDEQTDNFADYGTLLYIRGRVYTPDGRSIVDTIGQRRFRVIERGMTDGYNVARVQLVKDHPIEQQEFDDLFQLNRYTYNRVRTWFDRLDPRKQTQIVQRLEGYPICDDLTLESKEMKDIRSSHFNKKKMLTMHIIYPADGPSWTWIMINLLPIDELLQSTALASQSFRIRIQMISDAIDFLLNQQENHQQQQEEDKQEPEPTAPTSN